MVYFHLASPTDILDPALSQFVIVFRQRNSHLERPQRHGCAPNASVISMVHRPYPDFETHASLCARKKSSLPTALARRCRTRDGENLVAGGERGRTKSTKILMPNLMIGESPRRAKAQCNWRCPASLCFQSFRPVSYKMRARSCVESS